MKSLFYSWLVFQILIGIWMFISPFVFGFGETDFGVNNMIFGGVVVILGVGVYLLRSEPRAKGNNSADGT